MFFFRYVMDGNRGPGPNWKYLRGVGKDVDSDFGQELQVFDVRLLAYKKTHSDNRIDLPAQRESTGSKDECDTQSLTFNIG